MENFQYKPSLNFFLKHKYQGIRKCNKCTFISSIGFNGNNIRHCRDCGHSVTVFTSVQDSEKNYKEQLRKGFYLEKNQKLKCKIGENGSDMVFEFKTKEEKEKEEKEKKVEERRKLNFKNCDKKEFFKQVVNKIISLNRKKLRVKIYLEWKHPEIYENFKKQKIEQLEKNERHKMYYEDYLSSERQKEEYYKKIKQRSGFYKKLWKLSIETIILKKRKAFVGKYNLKYGHYLTDLMIRKEKRELLKQQPDFYKKLWKFAINNIVLKNKTKKIKIKKIKEKHEQRALKLIEGKYYLKHRDGNVIIKGEKYKKINWLIRPPGEILHDYVTIVPFNKRKEKAIEFVSCYKMK